MRKTGRSPTAGLLLVTTLLIAGCSSPADELQELVEDLTRRQAAQQERLLKQSEQLSEASRQLIATDAKSRRELIEMQSELQQQFEAERQNLDRQREQLDDERREIARQRHRDPLIAAAILQSVTLATAMLPVVLCILLLRAARSEEPDTLVSEMLVQELTAEEPLLLQPRLSTAAALEHPAPMLDGPNASRTDAEPQGSGESSLAP